MRIAFLINALGYGGAERVFVNDANDLARGGDDVILFVLYGDRQESPLAAELHSRVRFVRLRAGGPFDIRAVIHCVRELERQGTTALISTLNDANIFARWVGILMKGRLRVYMREANSDDRRTKTWWQRILDTLLYWVPERVIMVSDSAADRHKRVAVLPNAVKSVPEAGREDRGRMTILSVGSFTAQKDHATFLKALAQARDAGIDFDGVIVGTGALDEEVRSLAAAYSLFDQLIFTGAVPHEEVFRHYANADLYVLTSRWEGSPNVVLEAMANGLPVIATRVGGVPGLVDDGVTGILVEPGDAIGIAEAIARLGADDALRKQLGKAGREKARRDHSREARLDRLRAIVTSTYS